MKNFITPLIMMMCYIVVLVLNRCNVAIPSLIRNYFADLLCLPVLLSVTMILIRQLRDDEFVMDKKMVATGVVYTAFIFEFVLPDYFAGYTSDMFDVACYGIGGIVFYIFRNQFVPLKSRETKSKYVCVDEAKQLSKHY